MGWICLKHFCFHVFMPNPNHTNTWSYQTVAFLWKNVEETYSTTKETWRKEHASHKFSCSCNRPDNSSSLWTPDVFHYFSNCLSLFCLGLFLCCVTVPLSTGVFGFVVKTNSGGLQEGLSELYIYPRVTHNKGLCTGARRKGQSPSNFFPLEMMTTDWVTETCRIFGQRLRTKYRCIPPNSKKATEVRILWKKANFGLNGKINTWEICVWFPQDFEYIH